MQRNCGALRGLKSTEAATGSQKVNAEAYIRQPVEKQLYCSAEVNRSGNRKSKGQCRGIYVTARLEAVRSVDMRKRYGITGT